MSDDATEMETRCAVAIVGHEPDRALALAIVRDVIRAMREPGNLMEVGTYTTAKAAADWYGDRLPENFDMTMTNTITRATWVAMIDAASPIRPEDTAETDERHEDTRGKIRGGE